MSEKEIKGVRVIVFNVIFRKERKKLKYFCVECSYQIFGALSFSDK
jgi:hypothetical protein